MGYYAEAQRLDNRRADSLTRLSEALRSASDITTNYVQSAVRAPRWSKTHDTLYFTCPVSMTPLSRRRPGKRASVWLVRVPDTKARRVWIDSTCSGPGLRVVDGSSVVLASQARPERLWALEQHALYVDKTKGGLWVQRAHQAPELLALLVDQFRVEPDSSSRAGFSLGLSAAWQVTDQTAIRRSVYRYVAAEKRWEG